MTERTATNYMNAASISAEIADGKPETVSELPAPLPATVLYRLAAAPEPVRAALVRRAAGGELLTAAAVAEARAEARAEAERKAREEAEARVPRRTKAARLRREEEWRRQCEERRARRQAGEHAAREVAALLLHHLPAEARPEARRLLAVVDTNSGWHPVGEALHGMLEEAGQGAADASA